jgi:acyl-CoA thioester hydrolase
MPDKPLITRLEYVHFQSLNTRWMDNDIYGHINNALYYGFFDTSINNYLIDAGGLDIANGPVIAFTVESQCRYFSPLSYPTELEIGLRVGKLGNSSIRYELAIFKRTEDVAAAAGYFVHVFVDRSTQKPVAIPAGIRVALEKLVV